MRLVLLQVELSVVVTATKKGFDSLIYFASYLFGEASSVDFDGVPAERNAYHQIEEGYDDGEGQSVGMDEQGAGHAPEHEDEIPPPKGGVVRAEFVHDSADHGQESSDDY